MSAIQVLNVAGAKPFKNSFLIPVTEFLGVPDSLAMPERVLATVVVESSWLNGLGWDDERIIEVVIP